MVQHRAGGLDAIVAACSYCVYFECGNKARQVVMQFIKIDLNLEIWISALWM